MHHHMFENAIGAKSTRRTRKGDCTKRKRFEKKAIGGWAIPAREKAKQPSAVKRDNGGCLFRWRRGGNEVGILSHSTAASGFESVIR